MLGCSVSPDRVKIDDFGLGQHSGNSSLASGGHPVGDFVQAVTEQVPVLVQRHGGRGMTEHLLHDLDVGARGDGEAGCRVSKLVRMQAGPADLGGGRVKGCRPEDRRAQRAARSGAGEDEFSGVLRLDVRLELVDEERRDRNLASLVTFGGTEHLLGADEGDRLGNDRPAPEEIETADAQRGELAKPNTGVGEHEHNKSVVVAVSLGQPPVLADYLATAPGARPCEPLNLFVGEVLPLGLDDPRQVDGGSNVAG